MSLSWMDSDVFDDDDDDGDSAYDDADAAAASVPDPVIRAGCHISVTYFSGTGSDWDVSTPLSVETRLVRTAGI